MQLHASKGFLILKIGVLRLEMAYSSSGGIVFHPEKCQWVGSNCNCCQGSRMLFQKIVQATSFKKPSPGEAITDLLVFIISPMKHLQLCYGDVLLWDSSMGNIGVNVSLETCSNDSNRTVCYLQLCYLACTKNRAINSLINCIIVTFYPCAILH